MGAERILNGPEFGRIQADPERTEFEKIAREYERVFLLDLLSDGPLTWKEIKAIGKDAGFTEISLRRARADARLIHWAGEPAAVGLTGTAHGYQE
jgi:hypothetical protein